MFGLLASAAAFGFAAGSRFGSESDEQAVRGLRVAEIGFEMRRSLVVSPTAGKQVFATAALLPMLGALREGTLERVGRVDDATFYRLVPITEKWHPPAIEQLPASFDVYCSFSCYAEPDPEGDRVVVIVPPGSDAVVTKSRWFARFSMQAAIGLLLDGMSEEAMRKAANMTDAAREAGKADGPVTGPFTTPSALVDFPDTAEGNGAVKTASSETLIPE